MHVEAEVEGWPNPFLHDNRIVAPFLRYGRSRWLSVRYIQEYTGLTTKTINPKVARMLEEGVLERTKATVWNGKRPFRVFVYRPTVEAEEALKERRPLW
jgi:hypothetical protein